MNNYEKQQTAVEWFYQRILAKDIESVFEQAKKMEKQQIIDAFCEGRDNSVDYFTPSDSKLEEENYYKERFNNK